MQFQTEWTSSSEDGQHIHRTTHTQKCYTNSAQSQYACKLFNCSVIHVDLQQKQQQQQQALHGGGGYQMLQPGMQLSPINPPTTLPPEYGAFPRVLTPHSHSQSPTSHPPPPAIVSSYSTHLSNKLSDHGIGPGYPVFSPQQTQGLLTMEPPNHGQYSPLRNHSMASYGVGGGTHMQQKQTTLLQMPQVQLPLKAEGGGDSDTKAIQKGRKRPLSHSGSVSSTDNPGKTA